MPFSITKKLVKPFISIEKLAASRSRGSGVNTDWGLFDGTTWGSLDSDASGMHGANGDYWYAFLLKGSSGIPFSLTHTADSGPFIRLEENVDKCRYWLRRDNFTTGADEDTTSDVFDDAERLIIWETQDEGTNAKLWSWVYGDGAATDHGSGSEGRQGQGVNWPPNRCTVGGFAATASYVGSIGWMAMGTGTPLSSGNEGSIASVYEASGRAGLTSEMASAAGADPVFAMTLDGESTPDFGTAPVWTNITYGAP